MSWSVIRKFVGMDLNMIDNFMNGEWITKRWKTKCGNGCFKAAMASCAWLL